MKIMHDVDMKEYTSFRAGGRADVMAVPSSVQELQEILQDVHEKQEEYLLLGNGSNTIFRDEGYHGVVIHLGEAFSGIEVEGERLKAGGAALISAAAHEAMEHGLGGMEPISGIPGSIGGAVFMNAGAYGGELKDVVTAAEFLDSDRERFRLPAARLDFGYRHSVFSDTDTVVLGAELRLTPDDPEAIRERMRTLAEKRRASQPLELPSAGSTFKRPKTGYAAALIDQSGLKGYRVGGAMVSEKHAGFVVNAGGASFADVLAVIAHVRETVLRVTGVELEPEVRIIQ